MNQEADARTQVRFCKKKTYLGTGPQPTEAAQSIIIGPLAGAYHHRGAEHTRSDTCLLCTDHTYKCLKSISATTKKACVPHSHAPPAYLHECHVLLHTCLTPISVHMCIHMHINLSYVYTHTSARMSTHTCLHRLQTFAYGHARTCARAHARPRDYKEAYGAVVSNLAQLRIRQRNAEKHLTTATEHRDKAASEVAVFEAEMASLKKQMAPFLRHPLLRKGPRT